MRVLLDAQLPRRLVQLFSDAGHDALHTLVLPLGNRTSDSDIIHFADVDQRIVITKDSDFVHSHTLYGRPARLLQISTGNIPNSMLPALLETYIPDIERAFQASVFVELSRIALIIHR